MGRVHIGRGEGNAVPVFFNRRTRNASDKNPLASVHLDRRNENAPAETFSDILDSK